MQPPVSRAGEHRLPREDGAHHEGVSHPQQSVGPGVQPLQREVRGLHTGTAWPQGFISFPVSQGAERGLWELWGFGDGTRIQEGG